MANLKTQVSLVLGQIGVESKLVGSNYVCSCPLPDHNDNQPSFAINQNTGLWLCFGCHKKGNLQMLMSICLGISDAKALSQVENAAYEDRASMFPSFDLLEADPKRGNILAEEALLQYTTKCPAYMLDRGFDKKFLRKYEIGYDEGKRRVVFIIRDFEGRAVGLTSRATLSNQEPKYLHSVFAKADHLYLSNKLKEVEGPSCLFLTEGHVDALNLNRLAAGQTFRLGKRDITCLGAVAIMGSMLSANQLKLIQDQIKPTYVVCAFDNDEAGEKATKKAVQALLQSGERAVYIASYPGKDPGDLTSLNDVQFNQV